MPARAQPYAAIVVHVWHDRMVNLAYFDQNGVPKAETSVRLLQDDDTSYPNDNHAQWMPYQVGQASKAWKEADTTVLAGGSGKLEIMPDPTAVVPEGLSMEQVARVCHEVNRAYCAALGDHSQAAWEDAPEWQRASARMGVDLHRMLPDAGPEASHIAWGQQKLDEGWTYGPIKDAVNKTHPCLVPFAQLPPEQQAKDFIFKAVVNALTPL